MNGNDLSPRSGNPRRQDWTAVVVELIVVIAGVFIGLQASKWNETLRTDGKLADFTQRPRTRPSRGSVGVRVRDRLFRRGIANAKRTADALSGAVPSFDEALLVAAYRATQYIFNAGPARHVR